MQKMMPKTNLWILSQYTHFGQELSLAKKEVYTTCETLSCDENEYNRKMCMYKAVVAADAHGAHFGF